MELKDICTAINCPESVITCADKHREYVIWREVVAHILSKYFNMTTVRAGRLMNKHHSSVLEYIRNFEVDYTYDKKFHSFAEEKIEMMKKAMNVSGLEEEVWEPMVGTRMFTCVYKGGRFIPQEYIYGNPEKNNVLHFGSFRKRSEALVVCESLKRWKDEYK